MSEHQAAGVDFGKLFASIDAMDTEGFLGFIDRDGEFRFASAAPVKGHDAIRGSVDGFFASVAALEHDVQRLIGDGHVVVCEGEVTYTRHDGSKITLPFANVFETDAGLISQYRIYIDIGPVFAT